MVNQEQIDEARRAAQERYELHCQTFPSIGGAASLIALYGNVPSFHDAEVLEVNLQHTGASTLRLSNPYPDIFGDDRVIVTLEIRELLDLDLDNFNSQNVLFGLYVCPLQPNPDRQGYYPRARKDGDYVIDLEATVGIGGTLTCGALKVT